MLTQRKVTKERVAGKTKSSTFFTQGHPALSKVLDFAPFLRLPPTVRRLINNSLSRIEVNYVMSNLEGELLVYDTLTGNIKARENYRENKLEGLTKTYYPSGKLSSERVFEMDNELESHCFTQEGKDTTCNIYTYKAVFKHTVYSSHIEYFKENFVRPNISKSKMAGKYKIILTIRSSGGIEAVHIIPKPVTELDEALRKFIMGSEQYFIPAYYRGECVKSKLRFDMIFVR